ncbi:MAG TPA: CoA pyrophosphatase [Anaerolineae bacterium]|nr:CoA pyrophosphatase [Anaerolineae bacterium]
MINDGRALRDLKLDDIRAALKKPLPGIAAQIKLAPEYRMEGLRATPPDDARPAGVLILLYPHNGVWHFPLMRRVEDGLVHGGQISLPGGSQEAGESLQATALREACEEIGAACTAIDVLGQLSTIYIPPSNFLVTPTVGCVEQRPDFRCDPREVAELIEVPLSRLFDRDVLKREPWALRGVTVDVPFYQIGPHKVWGATAMILSEFSMLLAEMDVS